MTQTGTSNDFLLPLAGYRARAAAALTSQGTYAYYWASSATGTNAYTLNFNTTNVSPRSGSNRANALAIRCFKNTPDPARIELTVITT